MQQVQMHMDTSVGTSSEVVTSRATKPPRRVNLRLHLASENAILFDCDALLSELEQTDEVTIPLLEKLRELIEEDLDSLSDSQKSKLVELVLRKVCLKRREDESVLAALLVLESIITKLEYTGDNASIFHSVFDSFVTILNGCDSTEIRVKIFVVICSAVARASQTSSLQQATTLRKLCDRVAEFAFAYVRNAQAKVRCTTTELLANFIRYDALSNDSLGREAFRSMVAGAADFDPAVRTASLRSLLEVLTDRLEFKTESDSLNRVVDDWNTLYKLACGALDDDYDEVRAAALRCIFLLAHTTALRDRPVNDQTESANDESTSVRRSTVDDAFVRLCSAMTDGSGVIRVSAARLLGGFGRSVSFECVREAIEPRIMVDLRAERSMYRRQADRFRGGSSIDSSNKQSGASTSNSAPSRGAIDLEGWTLSTANQKNSDKPPLAYGDLDISEMPLAISDRSANGALIAGLEDELASVRNATLRTIVLLAQTFLRADEDSRDRDSTRLALLALRDVNDPQDVEDGERQVEDAARQGAEDAERVRNGRRFVGLTQDYLVDMINDEIEFVRVSAIRQLSRLGDAVCVRQDQLEIVLSALKEASRDVRDSLRQFLCSTRLTSKECLRDIVRALLDNLTRYPDDRQSLFACCARLGQTHAQFVAPLVPELLNVGPFFDTIEPPLDDPAYTCVLLLVLNACSRDPLANVQLPAFVVRHYEFLRSSVPQLVPAALQIDLHPSFAYVESRAHDSTATRRSVDLHVRNVLAKLTQANAALANRTEGHSRVTRFVNLLLDDLARIATTDRHSAFAQAERMALDAQIGFLASLLECESGNTGESTAKRLREAHAKFAELTCLFTGLSHQSIGNVKRWKLLVSTLLLLVEPFESVFDMLTRLTRVASECEADDRESKRIKLDEDSSLLATLRTTLKSQIEKARRLVETDVYDDTVPETHLTEFRNAIREVMREAARQFRFAALCADADAGSQVQRTRFAFNQPLDSVDTPIRFSAGLCASIHVDAVLQNLVDPSYLEYIDLLLRFADNTTLVFPIRHDAVQIATGSDVRALDRDSSDASKRRSSSTHVATSSYRVVMDLAVTQPRWSDEMIVELSAAIRISSATSNGSSKASASHLAISDKPVRLLLLPKGRRKK